MRDTCATGFVNPKTTALFFDKLYIPKKVIFSSFGQKNEFDKIPKKILFNFVTELDNILGDNFYFCCCLNKSSDIVINEIANSDLFIRDEVDLLEEKVSNEPIINDNSNCGEFLLSVFRNRFILKVAKEIKNNSYIDVIPIFFDKTDFEKSLVKKAVSKDCKLENPEELNHNNVYEALITCDQMIDESQLDWKQVLEIRKDKIEQAKLKRFRSWAEANFDNCSKEQIMDIIGKTYNDYVSALQKHGVKTLAGSLATIVTEAAIGMLSAWGGNAINYAGFGLQLAVGAIPLGRAVKNYVRLRKEPIAYYYDIKKRLK